MDPTVTSIDDISHKGEPSPNPFGDNLGTRFDKLKTKYYDDLLVKEWVIPIHPQGLKMRRIENNNKFDGFVWLARETMFKNWTIQV